MRLRATAATDAEGAVPGGFNGPPILGALTGGPGSFEGGRILWGQGMNTEGEL